MPEELKSLLSDVTDEEEKEDQDQEILKVSF
jgi:hypothetical protein